MCDGRTGDGGGQVPVEREPQAITGNRLMGRGKTVCQRDRGCVIVDLSHGKVIEVRSIAGGGHVSFLRFA